MSRGLPWSLTVQSQPRNCHTHWKFEQFQWQCTLPHNFARQRPQLWVNPTISHLVHGLGILLCQHLLHGIHGDGELELVGMLAVFLLTENLRGFLGLFYIQWLNWDPANSSQPVIEVRFVQILFKNKQGKHSEARKINVYTHKTGKPLELPLVVNFWGVTYI